MEVIFYVLLSIGGLIAMLYFAATTLLFLAIFGDVFQDSRKKRGEKK